MLTNLQFAAYCLAVYAAKWVYEKLVARTRYVSEKFKDPDVQVFMVGKDAPLTTYVDIPAGWYELCYMGDAYATAQISTGIVYDTAEYPLAEFAWSAAERSLYEIYSYPLCPGFTISLTDCGDGTSEYVFLVLIEEIAFSR